jgi:ribosome-associated translation inhibitor RaiA
VRIELRGRAVEVTAALRPHAERRVRFALGRFGAAVRRVSVQLDDVNGPRGGVDKRVRVVVGLASSGEVIIEDESASLPTLFDRSVERAGRAVARVADCAATVTGTFHYPVDVSFLRQHLAEIEGVRAIAIEANFAV